MPRILNEYITSIGSVDDLTNHLADNTMTRATVEDNIGNNQFYFRFNNYFTMKSNGTKRVGIVLDLSGKVTHGDILEASLEIRSISGVKPSIVYEEWNDSNVLSFGKLTYESVEHFEIVRYKNYLRNAYGNRNGRLFIGLEIGEVGEFSFRFPTIKHHAQAKYTDNISRVFNGILERRNSSVLTHGIKIKTNIPINSFTYTTLHIHGYNYTFDPGSFIDFKVTFFASSEINGKSATKYGSSLSPTITLAVENGLIVLFINHRALGCAITVNAFDGSNVINPSYYQGWTSADELISESATLVSTVNYI